MFDISSIASQVKLNCNISDARHWGSYLPCGLLLRLRDLYRIENRLKPWEPVAPGKIADWIGERERLWEEYQTRDFRDIEINGKRYNPFDVRDISSILSEQGFLYGAGYGEGLKPVFILAEISSRSSLGRYGILIAGREIARDLSTSPAMLQGNTIIARQETANLFLWGKFEEMRARKCGGTLFRAFSAYGMTEKMCARHPGEHHAEILDKITREEIRVYIHHEFGEASQRRVFGRWWKDLLLKLPYSRAELFLRGLKDVLADTCRSGMLSYIIREKKTGSLHFYAALLGGFRRVLSQEMIKAYDDFLRSGEWSVIEKARDKVHREAKGYVKRLKEMYDRGAISSHTIEQEIMPLCGLQSPASGSR
jgi:hypothetical protein